ncbi:hypothetical protein [Chryseobacterium proteolyticum]|uniref:hypothetical protein n=1 Tax=Chryseobacterium proteolyticum TaxID=118127 RepID=UPI003983AE5B
MGGITLVKSSDPIDIISLNTPGLFIAAVHPQVEVKTSDARQILKKKYSAERCHNAMGKYCRAHCRY